MRLLASVLGSFPSDQLITLNDDSNTNDILLELSDACKYMLCVYYMYTCHIVVSSNVSLYSTPQVFPYLSQTVLTNHIQYTPNVTHHFNLRQTPRASTQLRTEVLHRGIYAL